MYAIYTPSAGHFGHSFWRLNWGQNHLAQIAEETGGESYMLGFGPPVSFAPYLTEVAEHLAHQYLVTFLIKPGEKAGFQASPAYYRSAERRASGCQQGLRSGRSLRVERFLPPAGPRHGQTLRPGSSSSHYSGARSGRRGTRWRLGATRPMPTLRLVTWQRGSVVLHLWSRVEHFRNRRRVPCLYASMDVNPVSFMRPLVPTLRLV